MPRVSQYFVQRKAIPGRITNMTSFVKCHREPEAAAIFRRCRTVLPPATQGVSLQRCRSGLIQARRFDRDPLRYAEGPAGFADRLLCGDPGTRGLEGALRSRCARGRQFIRKRNRDLSGPGDGVDSTCRCHRGENIPSRQLVRNALRLNSCESTPSRLSWH